MTTKEALAQMLDEAQRTATAAEQPSADAALTLDAAYAVQHALIARRLARGEKVTGLKLGFTSQAKARQMGVSDVILGTITDAMCVDDGGGFELASAIHPRIEPEVAYLLGTVGDSDQIGIVAVAPALEIIDSRYHDFRFDLGDVIADNTSAAAYVIGAWVRADDAGSIDNRAVRLEIDGQLSQTGSTAAILGDPARAVAAAQRLAHPYGFALQAGMVLLAGAATAAVTIPQRGVVEAHITGLGRVSVRINGESTKGEGDE